MEGKKFLFNRKELLAVYLKVYLIIIVIVFFIDFFNYIALVNDEHSRYLQPDIINFLIGNLFYSIFLSLFTCISPLIYILFEPRIVEILFIITMIILLFFIYFRVLNFSFTNSRLLFSILYFAWNLIGIYCSYQIIDVIAQF